MSEWMRQTLKEDEFKEMHGFKPQVWYLRISNNEYKVKIIWGEKEAIITEVMDKGFPKSVTLSYDNKNELFAFPFLAENRAVEYLRVK